MTGYTVDLGNTTESARQLVDLVNFSGDPRVTEVKMLAARLVTILTPISADRAPDAPVGASRLASIAITQIEGAAMTMVKALTRKPPPAATGG